MTTNAKFFKFNACTTEDSNGRLLNIPTGWHPVWIDDAVTIKIRDRGFFSIPGMALDRLIRSGLAVPSQS